MRPIMLLLFLSIASPSFAEDPLETLNTVEDTLSTMQHTLKANRGGSAVRELTGTATAGEAAGSGDGLFFISDEPLGERGWVPVTPCTEETAPASILVSRVSEESGSCGSASDGTASSEGHLWKSRLAAATDLRPGVVVIAKDKVRDGAWVLAKITDVSELGSGYVTISAPFKAQLKNLRVVEE